MKNGQCFYCDESESYDLIGEECLYCGDGCLSCVSGVCTKCNSAYFL